MNKKKLLGKVLNLLIESENDKIRKQKKLVFIDENGIIGDKFYKKDKDRSILVSSITSYDIVKNQNIKINYGDLKENIIFNFDVFALKTGTKLYINESIIQIFQQCTICNHLEKIDKTLPLLLEKHRGLFVKVLKSGSISKNDLVYIDEI